MRFLSKKKKWFKPNKDEWIDVVLTFVVSSGLTFGFLILFCSKLYLDFQTFSLVLASIVISMILLFLNLSSTTIRTDFDQKANHQILERTLNSLELKFKSDKNRIRWVKTTYLQLFIDESLISLDNEIIIRFKYAEHQGIYPLFFFGIRRFYRKHFMKELSKSIQLQHS